MADIHHHNEHNNTASFLLVVVIVLLLFVGAFLFFREGFGLRAPQENPADIEVKVPLPANGSKSAPSEQQGQYQ